MCFVYQDKRTKAIQKKKKVMEHLHNIKMLTFKTA